PRDGSVGLVDGPSACRSAADGGVQEIKESENRQGGGRPEAGGALAAGVVGLVEANRRDDDPGDRQEGGDELQPRQEAAGHAALPAAGKHSLRVSYRSVRRIPRSA